jgi:hypothetical protein
MARWGDDQSFRFGEEIIRWSARTYGELYEEYRRYWHTLHELIGGLSEPIRNSAIGILLSSARSLLAIYDLRDEIIPTLGDLASRSYVDGRVIIETIESILRYNGEAYPENIVHQLTAIRDGIIGQSFGSRLRRFAGMDLLRTKLIKVEIKLTVPKPTSGNSHKKRCTIQINFVSNSVG